MIDGKKRFGYIVRGWVFSLSVLIIFVLLVTLDRQFTSENMYSKMIP